MLSFAGAFALEGGQKVLSGAIALGALQGVGAIANYMQKRGQKGRKRRGKQSEKGQIYEIVVTDAYTYLDLNKYNACMQAEFEKFKERLLLAIRNNEIKNVRDLGLGVAGGVTSGSLLSFAITYMGAVFAVTDRNSDFGETWKKNAEEAKKEAQKKCGSDPNNFGGYGLKIIEVRRR